MADMQGLKFRVPQSAVLIAAYKAFGGSPTPISWAETFTASSRASWTASATATSASRP